MGPLANSIVLSASFEDFFRVHWQFSVVMADEVDDRFEEILALFLDKDFGHRFEGFQQEHR